MLRQIKYFQSVVHNNSFSEAAEECHISQSAISQQIKSLERELGVQLLERKNRKFILTPAGEHFYKKSLILIADYEQLCRETLKIASGNEATLRIGYPRNYGGNQIRSALEAFSQRYPHISVHFVSGNHEELFTLLRTEELDLVLNDQRRAFSDEYVNYVLKREPVYIEISSRNSISVLPKITVQELKNIPCILTTSKGQFEMEQEFYKTVIGLQGDFICAESLEEARLLAINGQGFVPIDFIEQETDVDSSLRHIPLWRGKEVITRNYCAFWKKDNSGYYVEEFADILKGEFE